MDKRSLSPSDVALPIRPFLYTVDQVANILGINPAKVLSASYCHFDGRSIGFPKRGQLRWRNISMPDETPEWRCAERDLIRFLKHKGFKVVERGFVDD